MIYNGSCLCSAIRYQVIGDFESTSHCHCTMCQKQHGAACGSYGTLDNSQVQWLSGLDTISYYQSSPGVLRGFCSHCGSSLTWVSESQSPGKIAIALGTLDTPYENSVTRNIFTETRVKW